MFKQFDAMPSAAARGGKGEKTSASSRQSSPTGRADIAAAAHYINRYGWEGISVERVVKETQSVPQATFVKDFKNTTGQTPREAILCRQLAEARRLLAGTELSLHFIAECCGFKNPKALAKAFEDMEGKVPCEFSQKAQLVNSNISATQKMKIQNQPCRSVGPSAMLAIFLLAAVSVFAAPAKQLHGHVPEVVKHLTPKGDLPATNELHLAIGVPLHDQTGFERFVAEINNPASASYHHYLTPEEFAARFAATEQDYAALKKFANANGFKISREHGNRLLLDVTARAADVEKAFHIHLRKYQHPTEAREFYAPDTEPTFDASLPVADIQGLDNYSRPHPFSHPMDVTAVTPHGGSAPDASGGYFGDDFRNAYAPGTTLTGAGQMVGLLQFNGFYSNDIAAYATAAGGGRSAIPISTVLLDGYNGVPTSAGNGEVSLDIEMVMAMAPGVAGIVLFEADPNNGVPNDILNSMASSNMVKNLSASWGWMGGPTNTTHNIFLLMNAQGQSYFNASGDSDAYTTGLGTANSLDDPSNFGTPGSDPNITVVGGTTLTMNGTGASYASEKVWNWGTGQGSSGGISSYYSIPSWQTNVSMANNGGSTVFRNIPDVALTADNVYVAYGQGQHANFGGTSCATPLWAGFTALMNQQAASKGNPPVGFLNPALYNLAASGAYTTCFNDITNGNNFSSHSPNLFAAVPGYDLCTGLGTPNGQNLINAIAGTPDVLGIAPAGGFAASGPAGGVFINTSQTFTLTNASASPLTWSLTSSSTWINISPTSGTLAAGAQATVTATLADVATNYPVGIYNAMVAFTNQTSQYTQLRGFSLQVAPPMTFGPMNGFTAVGSARRTVRAGDVANVFDHELERAAGDVERDQHVRVVERLQHRRNLARHERDQYGRQPFRRRERAAGRNVFGHGASDECVWREHPAAILIANRAIGAKRRI